MATTAGLFKRHAVGGITQALFNLTFTGTYVTGGDVVSFASVMGYTNREPDMVLIQSTGATGHTYAYDFSTRKVAIFLGGTQVANGAAFPADTPNALAFYISTPKLS